MPHPLSILGLPAIHHASPTNLLSTMSMRPMPLSPATLLSAVSMAAGLRAWPSSLTGSPFSNSTSMYVDLSGAWGGGGEGGGGGGGGGGGVGARSGGVRVGGWGGEGGGWWSRDLLKDLQGEG
jgi:hypothetical protein